ncbi:YtxH domain-containing protein [Runella sp.]|uniref:YtxH domain-containing protein n=1 Tax=Runella sp. TaxID=1960881 RepID=UPI003D0C7A03
MTSNSKIVLGLATAAAAGAVIGLLFAPEKGTEIRDKVRETANGFASDLLDALQRGRQQYTEIKDNVEDKAKELKSKAEDKVTEAKDRITDAKDRVNDEVDNVKNKAQRYA